MVLLITKFLDVAKFTTLTPLSLLISCQLSFPIVGLKISSLSVKIDRQMNIENMYYKRVQYEQTIKKYEKYQGGNNLSLTKK
jgi:hypothetical protein